MVTLVFIIMTRVEEKSDVENIVKELQIEMNQVNERLAFSEEKLMKTNRVLNRTQGKLLELDTENVHLKDMIKIIEEDQTNTKEDLNKEEELEREVSILKEPLFFHAFGYQDDV